MPPQGSQVRFDNQGDEYGGPPVRSQGFDLTGLIVRWGLAKSQREAEYVLLGVAVVAFIVAAFFLIHSTFSSPPPPPPPPNLAPDAASQ